MSVEQSLQASEGPVLADREWVAKVFREHYEELCAFVYGYVLSDDTAEDLVQDLFAAIWRNPERWNVAEDALRPLLFVAARNRALDHLKYLRVRERHIQRTLAAEMERTAPAADAEFTLQEIQRDIAAAVAALPAAARQIFLLSRDEGLTYREIAERLELSVKTVETQMSRSLKRLRAQLLPYLSILACCLLG